jgi:hypothetical protein
MTDRVGREDNNGKGLNEICQWIVLGRVEDKNRR